MYATIKIITTILNKFQYHNDIYANFIKLNKQYYNTTFLRHLPVFEKDYIKINSYNLYSGFVLRRPLDLPLVKKLNIAHHYAIVLGTDNKGMEWLIELSVDSNISLVSKLDFIGDFDTTQIELCSDKKISIETIVERAMSKQFDVYNLLDFNCIDFIHLCIHGRLQPKKSSEFYNQMKEYFNKLDRL